MTDTAERSTVWARLARLAAVAVLCGGLVSVLTAALWPQLVPRFVYLPRPLAESDRAPERWGYTGDETWLRTADGEDLHGWMLRSTAESRSPCTILFLHGNAGNMSSHAGFMRPFNAAGFDAFMFDYRGYGASSGQPSEQGLYTDAETAWQYVRDQGVDAERVIIIGHSLGTGVATHLASRNESAAIILAAPFASLPDAVNARAPWIPVDLLRWDRDRFESVLRVGALRSPVLVVVGSEDWLVLEESSRTLFEQAPEPRRWLDVPGGHNHVFGNREFPRVLSGLLELAPACAPAG